jgi:hypothetical protein
LLCLTSLVLSLAAISDRLFVAFDRQQRGGVDFEDFIAAMTVICKGSVEHKAACEQPAHTCPPVAASVVSRFCDL